MPVTPADIDSAVPTGGTPSRALTNAALKGLIDDIAAVGVGVGVGTVNTFADLPAPATVTGQRWWVLQSTGVWLVNRRTKGAYYSNGTTWEYLGDFPVTAAEVGNVPAGGIAAGDVQAALNELDTDKADKTAINPINLSNAPVPSPAVGTYSLGAVTHAGLTMPFLTASGPWSQHIQPLLGRGRVFGWLGQNGATTIAPFPGTAAASVTGTATARSAVSTNYFTRQSRVGWVSAATAAALAGPFMNTAGQRQFFIGNGSGLGGFLYLARFGVSDPATVAGARMFVGLSTSVAALSNVEPSTLTDSIGIAQLSTSSNLHIVFGGSVAQTPINLGASFPAGTLSADWYELMLFSSASDNTRIGYRVTRLNTNDVAEGFITNTTPGTTLPAVSTVLGFRNWRTNNATLLAVAIDIGSIVCHVD
jgi:hypothetical protein